jgi:hypothetical protein
MNMVDPVVPDETEEDAPVAAEAKGKYVTSEVQDDEFEVEGTAV